MFQKPGTNACDWDNPAQPAPTWPSALGPTADCTWDPAILGTRDDHRDQAGVQAFYFVNDFHDHLARTEIGFTDDTDGFGPDTITVTTTRSWSIQATAWTEPRAA